MKSRSANQPVIGRYKRAESLLNNLPKYQPTKSKDIVLTGPIPIGPFLKLAATSKSVKIERASV